MLSEKQMSTYKVTVCFSAQLHWVLYVDVICLCDDGNLLDSACFAAVSALSTSQW